MDELISFKGTNLELTVVDKELLAPPMMTSAPAMVEPVPILIRPLLSEDVPKDMVPEVPFVPIYIYCQWLNHYQPKSIRNLYFHPKP